MTNKEQLVERHILEYESRLKHVDELLERAHAGLGTVSAPATARKELTSLEEERVAFATHLEELRMKSLANWREEELEKAGPMGIWDALAQQLEKLVERIEK